MDIILAPTPDVLFGLSLFGLGFGLGAYTAIVVRRSRPIPNPYLGPQQAMSKQWHRCAAGPDEYANQQPSGAGAGRPPAVAPRHAAQSRLDGQG